MYRITYCHMDGCLTSEFYAAADIRDAQDYARSMLACFEEVTSATIEEIR